MKGKLRQIILSKEVFEDQLSSASQIFFYPTKFKKYSDESGGGDEPTPPPTPPPPPTPEYTTVNAEVVELIIGDNDPLQVLCIADGGTVPGNAKVSTTLFHVGDEYLRLATTE